MKRYTQTQKLTIAGICIALYIAVMMCTQTFAFGQYQVRIATAMYGLSAIFPFLIVPFGIANVISNTIMGGLGPLDMIGGGIIGIVTTSVIVLAKKYGCGNWCILFAITLGSVFISRPWRAGLAFRAARFAVLAAGIFCACRTVCMRPCRSSACNCT